MNRRGGKLLHLSIVIPIYNEEETLPELYRRLKHVLAGYEDSLTFEILFVNDGSTDRSMEIVLNLYGSDPRLKVIELSRNFGPHMAVSAGMDYAGGDAVILMDGDLQDPPEAIPQLVNKWREGYDVVYAVRAKRKENLFKRMAFVAFYRVLNWLSFTPMPVDTGIFSLMGRKVVDVLKAMPERNRYLGGLRAWAGFRQTGVLCERGARYAGKPRQRLPQLLRLAMDALVSFSYLPLRSAAVVGAAVSCLSFIAALYALYAKLFTSKAILGWTSILVATTFLGGLILLMLGVIGEYIARIYDEVKARPRYVVARKVGFDEPEIIA